MLNLLKKTTPWMVASLFVATSLFGQDGGSCPKPCAPKCEPKCPPKPCPKPCPQPCPPTQICPGQDPCCPSWATPVLNAAYNYPARTRTRCPWDVDFNASFIYWQPVQDNLELGIANTRATDVSTNGISGNFINMDFNYKPGFKVGMGVYFDHDNWDMQFMYTWFHTKQHQSSNGPDAPGYILPSRGMPALQGPNTFETASQKWHLNMDIADLDLGRWYYVGTKLTFRPNFGARAAWIRQRLYTSYSQPAETDTWNVRGRSSSWAIGAKTGLDTNWMVGSGFRVYGCGEADLLFTKYTRLVSKGEHVEAVATTPSYKVSQSKVYAVRTHLDLELGFGWGTYIDCNNWYMDFSAGYGFQVFFDQNMFRNFNDDTMPANSIVPNGNLYVHGLTVKFQLDF